MTRKGWNSLKLHFFVLLSLFPLDWKSEKERSVPDSWMCHGATSRWDSLPKDSVWRFGIPEYSQVLSKPMRKLEEPHHGEILWVLGTIKYFRIYPISENLVNVNKHTYSSLVLYLSYSLTGKFQVLPRQLEIGVWRQAPLVEIYDLPSHGRQIYRRGLAWPEDRSAKITRTTTSSTTTSNSNQQQPTATNSNQQQPTATNSNQFSNQ